MRPFPEPLENRLRLSKGLGLERSLSLPRGIDFCSNDYLGFACDPELRKRILRALPQEAMGSTGSRLLRGHTEVHEAAESVLARFARQEAALLYPSGYQANVGVLSALLGPGDRVYSDELNHASIVDGIRLSGCVKRIYRHRDLEHLEFLLREDEAVPSFKLIVTESLFSMEGDFAPLKEIAHLAEKRHVFFLVDEAHATGVHGAGLAVTHGLDDQVLATIHTGGKALGVSGAWVSGTRRLKDYLVGFSRAQIFSTAISPWIAATLMESVEYYYDFGITRAQELQSKILYFEERIGMERKPAPIIPWIVGDARQALVLAQTLAEQGFDVRAIRPPTVPEGKSRLRITLHWGNSESDLESLACSLLKLKETQ